MVKQQVGYDKTDGTHTVLCASAYGGNCCICPVVFVRKAQWPAYSFSAAAWRVEMIHRASIAAEMEAAAAYYRGQA